MESTKRFTCGSKDPCQYKDHNINCRCFAPYPVRQSCPSILRKDGKSWRDGSSEEEVLIK